MRQRVTDQGRKGEDDDGRNHVEHSGEHENGPLNVELQQDAVELGEGRTDEGRHHALQGSQTADGSSEPGKIPKRKETQQNKK